MNELDVTNIYFRSLGKYDLLSKEEVLKLAEKSIRGDISARNKIVNANLKLVVAIAKDYSNKYCANLGDLIAAGNVGLVIAAGKFDPAYNTCFSTYAQFWIRDEIRKFLNKNHDIVLPLKSAAVLSKEYNTFTESIDDENFCEKDVSSEYSDNVDENVEKKVAVENVRNFVHNLPAEDKTIISMRYGIDSEKKSMEEIGKLFLRDKQWVFRRIKKVIDNVQRCSKYQYLNFCC